MSLDLHKPIRVLYSRVEYLFYKEIFCEIDYRAPHYFKIQNIMSLNHKYVFEEILEIIPKAWSSLDKEESLACQITSPCNKNKYRLFCKAIFWILFKKQHNTTHFELLLKYRVDRFFDALPTPPPKKKIPWKFNCYLNGKSCHVLKDNCLSSHSASNFHDFHVFSL